MREAAYKGLVRPILEYGSSVWDPHYEGLIHDLEKVQKRMQTIRDWYELPDSLISSSEISDDCVSKITCESSGLIPSGQAPPPWF